MADTIAEGLRRRSMAVDVCYDGDAALERVPVHRYDVVVLDRDLPKIHGDDVCRKVVASGAETRVLMLTAAAGIRDRVDGLDLGADDYLTKPFAFAELAARVTALGRRLRPALPPVLERAGIRLDRPRHSVWRDGLLLALSPKEFAVLEVFMRAEGMVVRAEELQLLLRGPRPADQSAAEAATAAGRPGRRWSRNPDRQVQAMHEGKRRARARRD